MGATVRTGTIHWRYVLVGLCLIGLASFHLDRGSTVWAVIFGLAALSNAYLSIRPMLPSRFGGEVRLEAWQVDPAATLSGLPLEEMRRSLKVYERRSRSWFVIAVVGLVITASVILLIPPLALVAAALSLFSVYRLRRCRRSVGILRHTLDMATNEVTKDTGRRATQPQERSQ